MYQLQQYCCILLFHSPTWATTVNYYFTDYLSPSLPSPRPVAFDAYLRKDASSASLCLLTPFCICLSRPQRR